MLILFSCVTTVFGIAFYFVYDVLEANSIGGGGVATIGNLGAYNLVFFNVISVYMQVVENDDSTSSNYSDESSPSAPFSLILRKSGISLSLFNLLMKSLEPI